MKLYQFDDFNKNSAWLIFRLDSAITDGSIDFYMVMDLPSGDIVTFNPNHPRAHYLIGLMLKESGDIEGAVAAYQTAIHHYPPTDVFHLNEVYNNLGSAFYAGGNIEEAKSAWEKALLYLPSDKTTRRNLAEFIHNRKIG